MVKLRPTNRTRDDEIACPNYTSCNTLSLRLPPFLPLTSVIRNQHRLRPSTLPSNSSSEFSFPIADRQSARKSAPRSGISSAPASSFAVDASSVIYAARMFALVANSHVLPLTCCAHRGSAATTRSLALFVFQTVRGVGRAIDSKREPTAPTCFVT